MNIFVTKHLDMFKTTLLTLQGFLFSFLVQSQAKFSTVENEFSLFAGAIQSNIISDNIKNDKYADSRGKLAYNIGLNYCYYLNDFLGINFGAEYNAYQNATTYKGFYRSETSTVDRDNYIYYPTVDVNYTDTRIINAVDIPINLRINAMLGENFSWFLDLGVRLNAIVTNKINQNGYLSKEGSYPNPNYDNVFLLIENDFYLGFTTTKYPNVTKQVDSKGISTSFQLSTGFKADITKSTFLLVSGHYMTGKTDVGPKTPNDYQNVFGEKSAYAPFKLFQAGLKVGIGFRVD